MRSSALPIARRGRSKAPITPTARAMPLPVRVPMSPLICGPITGMRSNVESSSLLSGAGIILEHEPGNRGERQQQRKDGEEAPVRDLHTERVGAVIEELLYHGDRDSERWMPLLPAVQPAH
jgi:hypothetical protein